MAQSLCGTEKLRNQYTNVERHLLSYNKIQNCVCQETHARNGGVIFALPCHIACTCRLVAADVPNDVSTQYSVHIQTYYQQLSTWLPAVVLLAGATPAFDGQCPGALSSNTDTLIICFANNMPCRLTPAVIHYRL